MPRLPHWTGSHRHHPLTTLARGICMLGVQCYGARDRTKCYCVLLRTRPLPLLFASSTTTWTTLHQPELPSQPVYCVLSSGLALTFFISSRYSVLTFLNSHARHSTALHWSSFTWYNTPNGLLLRMLCTWRCRDRSSINTWGWIVPNMKSTKGWSTMTVLPKVCKMWSFLYVTNLR